MSFNGEVNCYQSPWFNGFSAPLGAPLLGFSMPCQIEATPII